jgi:hypothetical protein
VYCGADETAPPFLINKEMTMKKDRLKKERIENLVYLGKRINGGKPNECFAPETKPTEVMFFGTAKTIKGFKVGHVYAVKTRDSISYTFGNTAWVKEHADTERVMIWQAKNKAALVERDQMRMENRMAKSDSALVRAIADIRPAYWAIRAADRPGFELWLLNKLRSH